MILAVSFSSFFGAFGMVLHHAFDDHPEEGAIVGRLLVEYGEIEFEILKCLELVVGGIMTGVRLMYRLRSEFLD